MRLLIYVPFLYYTASSSKLIQLIIEEFWALWLLMDQGDLTTLKFVMSYWHIFLKFKWYISIQNSQYTLSFLVHIKTSKTYFFSISTVLYGRI